jgi:flagellar biosynthesis chaperone FliJ
MSTNSLEEQLKQIQITKDYYKRKLIELSDYENEILKQLGDDIK